MTSLSCAGRQVPACMLEKGAPSLVKMRSAGVSTAREAGTQQPIWASMHITHPAGHQRISAQQSLEPLPCLKQPAAKARLVSQPHLHAGG